MHYLDHATHSWPKPPLVYQARDLARSIHTVAEVARVVESAQAELAALLNIENPRQLSFAGDVATAMRMALLAFPWQAGDGLVISALESRHLLSLVLELARQRGVQVYIVPYSLEVPFDLAECEALLKTYPAIRLIAVSYADSVTGCILPIAEISRLAKRYGKRFLLDATQTAGYLPVDAQRDELDGLVLAANKALQGVGNLSALYLKDELTLQPADDVSLLPEIAALVEGVRWVSMMSLHKLRRQGDTLLSHLYQGLCEIPEVKLYGALESPYQRPLLSFNLLGHHPAQLANRLFDEFGIWARAGFHDSRLSHEAIGSIHRGGTVRVSMGYQTRAEDIDALTNALKAILVGAGQGAWGVSTRY